MNKTAEWLKGQMKEVVHSIIDKQPKDKIGRIDPAYTTGLPRIIFDGEEVVSGKQYTFLTSYVPVRNDRVYLKYMKGSYVICGKISMPAEIAYQKPTIPTFVNGWSNYYADDARALKYYRNTANQTVIRGTIENPADNAQTIIFTLPAGARPIERQIFVCAVRDGFAEIEVNHLGFVRVGALSAGARTTLVHLNLIVPLD